jgi:hypothetical protein
VRWTPNFEEKIKGGRILFINMFTREIGKDCCYLISEAEGIDAAHGTFPWKQYGNHYIITALLNHSCAQFASI